MADSERDGSLLGRVAPKSEPGNVYRFYRIGVQIWPYVGNDHLPALKWRGAYLRRRSAIKAQEGPEPLLGMQAAVEFEDLHRLGRALGEKRRAVSVDLLRKWFRAARALSLAASASDSRPRARNTAAFVCSVPNSSWPTAAPRNGAEIAFSAHTSASSELNLTRGFPAALLVMAAAALWSDPVLPPPDVQRSPLLLHFTSAALTRSSLRQYPTRISPDELPLTEFAVSH